MIANEQRGIASTIVGWLMLLICLSTSGPGVRAQEEDPPEPKPPETPAPPDILKDGTIDLSARVYILDSRNKPVYVPNATYGDYLDRASAAARRAEGGDAPQYKFDKFTVQARVAGKVADIKAQTTVTLNDLPRKFTDIPLRLQTCLLTQEIVFEGNGKSQVQVGRNAQPGYTWWLQAEANTTHTATLTGQSVVQVEGDRHSLIFALPAASCTVQVDLPANIQDIIVRGQGGELTSDEPIDNGRRVTIKSLGGDLNVSWRVGGDTKATAGAAEAISKSRVRVDDPREAWLAETLISLRAHGDAALETLVIELPEGSEWLASENQPGDQYSIVADEANSRKLTLRAAARGNLASIDNIPIRYRWKAPGNASETNWSNLNVPNLIIRGVDRHEGSLTLVVPASLGLEWKSPPGVALINQTSLGEMQSVQYQFQFVRQPLGLNVSFRREVNLAEVQPTYLVEVDRNGIKLTGWLECAFDRARQPELDLELGDWELDTAKIIPDMSSPMAQGELLNRQVIDDGTRRLLRLSSQLDPELAGVGRREQQVWRITAYRAHSPNNNGGLTLTVPSIWLLAPDQTRVPLEHASGLLLLQASDNVVLEYDSQASRSLLTDAMPASWQSLQSNVSVDRTLAYRFQSGASDKPVWSGRLDLLPRRIAAEQNVQLKVDTEAAIVHQRFTLQIANEALTQLQLATNGAKDVSVLVDGVPWVLESKPDDKAATADSADVAAVNSSKDSDTLIAKGGRSLIGRVVVEVHSQQPLPKLDPQASTSESALQLILPLASLAVDDALIRSPVAVVPSFDRRWQVSLGSREALSAQATGSSEESTASKATWSVIEDAGFEIPASQVALPLRLVPLEVTDASVVRVAGVWIQSVISGSTRADRFCARFKTAQDTIRLRLPANDLLAQVAIDGVEQAFNAPRDGQVQISLRDVSAAEMHTLEVWTRSTASTGWITKVEVVPIEIEGCSRFDHFYWQLVTNPNMHLAILPSSLTPEWSWTWDRLWWRRVSPMDQADLEQWLSASSQRPLAQAANKYVVSSYGAVAGFQTWTVSRTLLWLPIGLIAIGGAVLVSVFRTFRHPAALLLLMACVLSMATVWPDLAILLGQASMAALVIVLLYALTQAAIESRVRRRSVFTSRPTSGTFDISDNQTSIRPQPVGESDVMPTTRTQSPIGVDGGGA